jgi:nucleoside-diphosphate-sugar epimerase
MKKFNKGTNKGKVLITGGSGFLGINLARYLYTKGYDIAVIDLVKFDYPDMKDKITFLQGDIRHRKSVEKIMKGCDYVVHCAMALPLYPKEEIMTTGVDGTRIILETAEKFNIKRTVHISSTAVYGIPDHHPLKEDDRLQGVGYYGQAKILAEEVCLEFRNKGMIVPILRPKSFIGPERLGVFAIYYDWAHRGKNIPLIGNGKNRYQLLDVEDLCEAIRLSMTIDEKNANDTFNIGAKKFTTMAEDFGSVLKYKGANKHVVCIPAAPLILVLRILEFLKLSPLYKWVYETAPHDSFVSIQKAEKQLGYKPKYSNKDAIIRNYEWYLAHVNDFEGKSGVSHRVPWKQGILKFVSWFF